MSHYIVSEIKKILSRIEIHPPTNLYSDMASIIAECAGSVHMTYEPIQYLHLNPLPVLYVGMEDIRLGKR